MSDTYEQVMVTSRDEWRQWLAAHHNSAPGIWLIRFKKGDGRAHVAYDDVVEEALCFGWVDSRPRSLDAERSQLLVTPRNPRSRWSRANKERIERLVAAGLMQPAGLAAVETAKRNGNWSALDAVEQLEEPPDLVEALGRDAQARAEWDAFPPSAKRAILEWITSAKTAATRERRIATTVADAHVGRRANQWRQPKGR